MSERVDGSGGEELGGSFPLGPWRVRRAGYGAMQLAGDRVFGPPRNRDEALRVLHAAVAAGVDHIDTAQYYGAGTVNGLIREALYPYPNGLAIVSKVAARRDAGGALLRADEPHELRQGIEDNLATLGAARLAAVNLRVMDPSETPGTRFDAQLAALVQAREEKLIDGIGLSNISRPHLLRAVAQTEIVCVQNLFNLANQRSADVLAECEARNIAFVPFCPLGLPGEERRRLLADPVLAARGRTAGRDAGAGRAGLAAGRRPEHPAHPGDPHPRPPGREPRRGRRPARRRRPRRTGGDYIFIYLYIIFYFL